MGLRTMDWNEWIELDNHYLSFHGKKAARLASDRASKLYHTAPEAYDGAVELLEELCSYLPQRYPSMFKKTAVGMDNLVTGESLNVVERPLKEDPMVMCARQVQDDLAIMFERPDGQYYLLAGCILLAGFWRLEDKLGMALSEIHTSGSVPEYKTKLEKGMMNFFRRVKPENPVVRNNYFIQVDEDLAWSHSIGPEDGEEGTIGWFSAEKDKAIQHHYFRSERQSLRRYVLLLVIHQQKKILNYKPDYPVQAASSSPFAPTSTPSPKSATSPTSPAALPRPSAAGTARSRSTRARSATKRSCSNTLTRGMRSSWPTGWTWKGRMMSGHIRGSLMTFFWRRGWVFTR